MINSTDSLLDRPKSVINKISVEELVVKEEPIESSANETSLTVTETSLTATETSLTATETSLTSDTIVPNSSEHCGETLGRRGVKRNLESDEFCEDDDDECSNESDQFKDELDEDSSEDKGWATFSGLRKQRGTGRLSRTYGLRPRTGIRRAWVEGDASAPRGSTRRGRGRATPKSKYRRNTANARERDRMKEINVAFANLRGALPSFTCRRITSMTKIKTLKLAASYIRALSDLLSDSPSEESKNLALQLFQDLPDQNNLVSSIKQTLVTPSLTQGSSCSVQGSAYNKNDLQINAPTAITSSPFVTLSRPSSALEVALTTTTSKRTSFSDLIVRQYHQPGHHLTSRPHLITPPPLQLNNIRNVTNMQYSPTQRSPGKPNIPGSPSIQQTSESTRAVEFGFPASTIITANVNVIPLNSELSTSNQVYSAAPTTSPIQKRSSEGSVHSLQQQIDKGMPLSRPDTKDLFSNSGSSSPETKMFVGTQRAGYSPTSKINFLCQSEIKPENSHLPGAQCIGGNPAIENSNSNIAINSNLTNITAHSTEHQLSNHLHYAHTFHNQLRIPSHSKSRTQLSEQKSPLVAQNIRLLHNFPQSISQTSSLMTTAQFTTGKVNDIQSGHMNTPQTLISNHRDSEIRHQESDILSTAVAVSSPETQPVLSTPQDMPESLGGSGSNWGNMNVEYNPFLEESDSVPEDQHVNWDELCWT